MLAANALMPSALAFSASANNNLVMYWGQNSGGSQQSLASYCQDSTIDIIPISFLTAFGVGSYSLNFANMCGGSTISGSTLIQCDQIAADIKTCQAAGKKILLSMGGASGAYGFSSAAQAVQVANDMWNYFGGGSSSIRPFGDSIVDGFDLDIENNSPAYYPDFIAQMRSLYASQSARQYYISGAPQCVYPDASLSNALVNSYFDFLFIQFYNNWCGIYQYGSSSGAFNYGTWDTWAKTVSKNPSVKLYLGVAAAEGAANSGTGYVAPALMVQAAQDLQAQYPSTFGGVMMWDASQAYANIPSGYSINYAQIAKQALNGKASTGSSSTTTVAVAHTTSSVAAGNIVPVASSSASKAAPVVIATSQAVPAVTTTAPTTKATTAASVATSSVISSAGCTQQYTVASGDYCYAIWTKYGLSSDAFYALNPTLSSKNDCAIVPGQVLCVSNTGSTQAPSKSTTTSTTILKVTSTSTTTTKVAGVRPNVVTSSAAPLSTVGGACPVAGGACAEGSYQCNGYGYAQCVWGAWVLRACAAGTACAGSGNNIYCDWPGSAKVTCSGITGKTNSKRAIEENDLKPEVETSLNTQRLNGTHFVITLRAKATGIMPITPNWYFTFESEKDILESDLGVLYRDAVDGSYTISADPFTEAEPTRSLVIHLTGSYQSQRVVMVDRKWLW